ncbi:MAG: hypothetical protein RLZZ230_918 [Candidatus Parcubacteria bacterium]|jgi:putative endonuclease
MEHSIYVVRCADSSLYTGYAKDVEKRLKEHNGESETKVGKLAGARYTRGRRPVALIYTETFFTRSEAMKRECAIKKLSKKEKELLISNASKQ